MDYQERFVRQRAEVLKHFTSTSAIKLMSRSSRLPQSYFDHLKAGIRDYIKDQTYFRLTDAERAQIHGNEAFAEGAAEDIEARFARSATDEALQEVRKILEEKHFQKA